MIRMTEYLSPCEKGEARIEIFQVSKDSLYEKSFGDKEGAYARLWIDDKIMMTDTLMEWNTNMPFMRIARGDILIGGLGIGMIPLAIQDEPMVRSITILEKSQDVIDIVVPQLPLNNKVKIVRGDVFSYVPVQRYDLIYLDIWHEVDQEIYLEQMLPLKARYQRYVKKKPGKKNLGVLCWAEENARLLKPLADQDFSFLKTSQ